MKSYLPMFAVTMKISHRREVYGIADLAERLRRTLKARVRKSVGSIPTDCIFCDLELRYGLVLTRRNVRVVRTKVHCSSMKSVHDV